MRGLSERAGKYVGKVGAFLISVLLSLGVFEAVGIIHFNWFWEEGDSPSVRILKLEQELRNHVGVFDWKAHNELRHLYITSKPPNVRRAMEHTNAILEHSFMDDYMLDILSEWRIGKDNAIARSNLQKNAEEFPDLKFVRAACFVKIGDLYAADGNRKAAGAWYLKIGSDKSLPVQYRQLAEERARRL